MSHPAGVETLKAEEFSYSLFDAISSLPVIVNGERAASVRGDLTLLLQLTDL